MSAQIISIATGEPPQIPLCDPDLSADDLAAVEAVRGVVFDQIEHRLMLA